MTRGGKNIEGCDFDKCPAFRKIDNDERNSCPFFKDSYGGSSCWIMDKIYHMIVVGKE